MDSIAGKHMCKQLTPANQPSVFGVLETHMVREEGGTHICKIRTDYGKPDSFIEESNLGSYQQRSTAGLRTSHSSVNLD